MPLTLSVLTYRNQPPSRPIEHTFSGAGGTIGRESQNDLVLTDPGRVISRKHAQIHCIQDTYQLTNLGQNPIDVNGRPVGHDETVTLSAGDRLNVGDYCVVVAIDEDDIFQSPIAASAPTFTSPAAALDHDGPLLGGSDSQSAFGIDLGGRGSDASRASSASSLLEPSFDHLPLANLGTQRDELPGIREPLPSSAAMSAPQIPDDYDPLDGFIPKADAAPVTARTGDAPSAADDPFALFPPVVAPTVPPSAAPLPPYSPSLPKPRASTPTIDRQGSEAAVNATQPVPMPTASGPTVSTDYRQALRMLLDAAGVPELVDQVAADPDFPAAVGELLREAVAGLLKALAARALTKRELRVDMTMLSSTENNPLKFCPNAPEALVHLLAPRAKAGYLPPVRALRESYDDLQAHNLAVMAGMRAALLGVLQRFDPEELERRLGSRGLLDKLVSTNRKARLWDLVAQQHANLVREAQDEFDRIFGRAFRSAYEEQVRQIRAAGKASSLR